MPTQAFTGVLLSIDLVIVDGVHILEYIFAQENDERLVVRAANELNERIVPDHLWLWLLLEKEDSASDQKTNCSIHFYRRKVSRQQAA